MVAVRAYSCASRRVSVHSGPITEELMASHTVVVATNLTRNEALRWNAFCRAQVSVTCVATRTPKDQLPHSHTV